MKSLKPVPFFQEQVNRFRTFLWTQCYMNFRLSFNKLSISSLIFDHCIAVLRWSRESLFRSDSKIQRE